MKAVVLLAGYGKRISHEFNGLHKSLIPIDDAPLLSYWMKNIKMANIDVLVPVLGYKGEEVLGEIKNNANGIEIREVWNDDYHKTNNMVSLLKAASVIEKGEDFIQFNGDMIFDFKILKSLVEDNIGSAIAVDGNSNKDVDSPAVSIVDRRIADIGRHITKTERNGYAVGAYRYNADLWEEYVYVAKKLEQTEPQTGFHDPLRKLFGKYEVCPSYTGDSLWMDVDDKNDIERATQMVRKMY